MSRQSMHCVSQVPVYIKHLLRKWSYNSEVNQNERTFLTWWVGLRTEDLVSECAGKSSILQDVQRMKRNSPSQKILKSPCMGCATQGYLSTYQQVIQELLIILWWDWRNFGKSVDMKHMVRKPHGTSPYSSPGLSLSRTNTVLSETECYR